MKLHRIKHALMRLDSEEKVLGISAVLIILGTFLPWYNVEFSYDKNPIIESGFSGDLGIMGFTVFILTLLALIVLLGENLRIRIPRFGLNKEQTTTFLMGESAFLILLAFAIYTKRSLDFTNASLRFGIYLALASAVVGTFAGIAQIRKRNTNQVKAFFGQDETKIDVPEKEQAKSEEPKEPKKPKVNQMELEDFVEVEKEEVITEDEMIEDIAVSEDSNQAKYFTREAGISEEKPKNDSSNLGSNFYED